jgi:lantibiotic biosynthesis dehydratase-like protein
MTDRPWRLLSVIALRQAGFAVDRLTPYRSAEAATEAADLAAREAALRARLPALKADLRRVASGAGRSAATRVGQLRPLPEARVAALTRHLDPAAAHRLGRYQAGAVELAEAWAGWDDRCRDRLRAAAAALRTEFRDDPLLRDALLLSNEASFDVFAAWLDGDEDPGSPRSRRMADSLACYLQRFTTKNETHAHFGPVDIGRVDRTAAGLRWEPAGLRRRAYLSHWAAERIAAAISAGAGPERIRPRRRPWVFLRDGVVHRYEFTSPDGLSMDWRFRAADPVAVTPAEAELLDLCDGAATVAELSARLSRDVTAELAGLARRDLVVDRIEVPVGSADPLADLRAADPGAPALTGLARALATVPAAADRPAAIRALGERFTALTGAAANRGTGLHYADRNVFYEECHGRLADLRVGRTFADLVESELAPVYSLMLAAPRLRIIRERAVLADWVARRFGPGTDVPLDLFYRAYFDDRPALLAACDVVDAEVAALDRDLSDLLLTGADRAGTEVVLSAERLAAFLERCPDGPPAVCNPDVMVAAADPEAFARGDFLAVVGDCHGTRELLSHSSLGPLIAETEPGFAAEVTAAYQSLLEPGERLCDLARSHPDKTAVRVPLGMPDVEIYGRSGRDRREVLQPRDMVLRHEGGTVHLYAHGVAERLRMLAPPSGGPSIRLDPLAPLAFPRRLGGLGLQAGHLAYVPRIRTGRTVLQRRIWRVPAEEIRGVGPGGVARQGDAAELFAATLLRRRYGLPEQVFVKFEAEPKPLYVDFAAPVLVRQMFRFARQASGPAVVSEMLPDAGGLWLHRDGSRFTSEIRCAMFSGPTR